jgi:hypothetical protein
MGCCANRRSNNNVYEPTKLLRGLTPDQIQKLKTNLKNLIDFNDLSYSTTSPVIDEVYHYLNSVQKTDPGVSVFENLLDSSYELIGELPIPGASIISWLIGGILDSYSSNTPQNLNLDFGEVAARYNKTYYQIRMDLTTMYNNPFENIDKVYSINFGNKKTITLRELLDYDVPSKDDKSFTELLQAHTRGFRSALCKQELPKTKQWSIAFVSFYDGFAYVPGNNFREIYISPTIWEENFTAEGELNWIDNEELVDHHKDIPKIGVSSPNLDLESMKQTCGKFCQLQPQAYVNGYLQHVKWNNEYTITVIFKYYLMEHFDGPNSWTLANASFCNWLFKDDSFGNIINPDGCGLRSDVLRNWGGIINANLMLGEQPISYDFEELIKLEKIKYLSKRKDVLSKKVIVEEEVKVEEPKVEEPKVEEVKVEDVVEEPKVEEPKVDVIDEIYNEDEDEDEDEEEYEDESSEDEKMTIRSLFNKLIN